MKKNDNINSLINFSYIIIFVISSIIDLIAKGIK